ncbi:hypothetical protein B0I35DRAFT_430697 [Stachybotrys elegans]|uniref:Uncharacterized protein n=1 Tax=Stachybotrys elegans TaxID=80388 RepID=A0A8K0ST35_9HYPO|nr:hypothetical protein B0I35DRAFT_430697 [Stachybotrys elegans]
MILARLAFSGTSLLVHTCHMLVGYIWLRKVDVPGSVSAYTWGKSVVWEFNSFFLFFQSTASK